MERKFAAPRSRLVLVGAVGILHAVTDLFAAAGEGAGRPVDVGGYGSFRYEANDSGERASSITLRRFVVTTDAHPADRLQVYSELEYERLSEIEIERGVTRSAGGLAFEQEIEGTSGGEIAVEQAWAQLELTPGLRLRFGAVLPPVGRLNVRHDDNLWNFPRRPLIERGAQVLPGAAAWTEMGVGITGEQQLGDGAVITYEGYLLNGVELDFALEEKVQTRVPRRNKLVLEAAVRPTAGAFDGSNTSDAVAARVLLSPALGSEIALSGYYGEYTPAYLDADATLWTAGVDGRQRLGPVDVQAEFLYTHAGGLRRTAASFARAAVDRATETGSAETARLESEAEIALQGLTEDRYGLWIDAALPVALGRGRLGLEAAEIAPVARYEEVWYQDDLSQLDFASGQVTAMDFEDLHQRRFALGVTFRPVPQAVFHLVYERDRALQGPLLDPAVGDDALNGVVFGMAFGF